MSLGKVIKDYRKANHLSQTSFGEKLGYSREAIRQIENNEYGMLPLEKVNLLADYMKIPFEQLIKMTYGQYSYKGKTYYKIYVNQLPKNS